MSITLSDAQRVALGVPVRATLGSLLDGSFVGDAAVAATLGRRLLRLASILAVVEGHAQVVPCEAASELEKLRYFCEELARVDCAQPKLQERSRVALDAIGALEQAAASAAA
jgi:hypothetical protein